MKLNKTKIHVFLLIVLSLVTFVVITYFCVIKPRNEYIDMQNEIDALDFESSINFGKYEQDGSIENGKEDIEWCVVDGNSLQKVLISKYVLDYVPYDKNCSYSESELRKWLNNDFYNEAFSKKEKEYISSRYVSGMSFESDMDDYVTLPTTVDISSAIVFDMFVDGKATRMLDSVNTLYSKNKINNNDNLIKTLIYDNAHGFGTESLRVLQGSLPQIEGEISSIGDDYESYKLNFDKNLEELSNDINCLYGIRPVIVLNYYGIEE